jgi:hypothetical protein
LQTLSPVLDQVQVQPILDVVGHDAIQQSVRFCLTDLLFNPAQSLGDAVDVGVNGENGLAETEEQHARRRLRTDAGQPLQPRQRFGKGHRAEKRQIQLAPVSVGDFLQDGFDAGRFLVR